MKVQLFGILGFNLISNRELPRILEIGLLTSKNIRRSLPEKLANFDGTRFVEQVKSDPLFKEPIDSFHELTELCARHTVNILILSRGLRTADDLKSSFEMRFTMFFDLYMMVILEQRLRKAFHFWPCWPRVKNSKCFNSYHSSTLFAMLDFCSELKICFGGWLFDVSDMKSNLRIIGEAVDLKFIDWINKVSMFKQFFNGVGNLNFPEIVSTDYDLKEELNRVIGGLRYEHDEAKAKSLLDETPAAQQNQRPKMSRPLGLKKWAYILNASINKVRDWRDDPKSKYHFDKVSDRKWRLPLNELPAEYLDNYRKSFS